MTIEIVRGDIFRSGCDALVCAANARGVMGAGQALEVARRFPKASADFRRDARGRTGFKPGEFSAVQTEGEPWIFFAIVKDNPRCASRLSWITETAGHAASVCPGLARSVAVPALGCGLGGLRWDDVRPVLVEAFRKAPAARWKLYAPLEPAQLAEAVALHLQSPTVRTNVSHGPRTRVYLARGRARLGWITVDPGWGLHASGGVPADYKAMAEDVRREMLDAIQEEVLERVD